jgi:hypothetical protein
LRERFIVHGNGSWSVSFNPDVFFSLDFLNEETVNDLSQWRRIQKLKEFTMNHEP